MAKKRIHEAQTDLIPTEKKEIPAGDVRLFLKNLTLHNMQTSGIILERYKARR